MKTSIEWTEATWNPVRGCSRVSEGCRNCYAERIAGRFSGPGQTFEGFARIASYTKGTMRGKRPSLWTGRVELFPEKLEEPLHWRKPRMIFVNSMSDLFHESLPDDDVGRVFAVMAMAQQHTFQVLTKRADRMRLWFNQTASGATREALVAAEVHRRTGGWPAAWPLPNVWLGVSVEDQKTADERLPLLLQTPAAVRFVSYEPALGPVDFRAWLPNEIHKGGRRGEYSRRSDDRVPPSLTFLDWLIVGGESGPGARPMHPDWPAAVRRHCGAACVPFFMKQRGAWMAKSWGLLPIVTHRWGTLDTAGNWYESTTPWNGRRLDDSPTREEVMVLVGGKGEHPLHWPEDLRVREWPR